jgi:hypothetical protein
VGTVINDYPMLEEIQGEIERRAAIPTMLDPDDPGEPANSL